MMSSPHFYNYIVNSSTSLKWRNPTPADYFMDKYYTPSNNNNSLSLSVDVPFIKTIKNPQLDHSKIPIEISNDEEVLPAPDIKPQEGGKSPPDPTVLTEGEKHMVIHDLIKEWVAQWCETFSYYAPPIIEREVTQMDEVRRSHVYDELWNEMFNTGPPPTPGNGPPIKGSNPYNYIVNNEFRVVPTFLLSPQTSLGWEWYLLKDTANLPRSFDPPKV